MKSLGALDLYYVWNIWSIKKIQVAGLRFWKPIAGGDRWSVDLTESLLLVFTADGPR